MNKNRNIFVFIIILGLVFITGCEEKVDPIEAEITSLVVDKNYEKAEKLARESYNGKELDYVINFIEEMKDMDKEIVQMDEESKNIYKNEEIKVSDKLKINDWTYVLKNGYLHITGSVKNESNSDIRYFKLTAEFLDDDGKILNTTFTNSNEIIKPRSMKKFSMTEKNDQKYKDVRLLIDEVKTK